MVWRGHSEFRWARVLWWRVAADTGNEDPSPTVIYSGSNKLRPLTTRTCRVRRIIRVRIGLCMHYIILAVIVACASSYTLNHWTLMRRCRPTLSTAGNAHRSYINSRTRTDPLASMSVYRRQMTDRTVKPLPSIHWQVYRRQWSNATRDVAAASESPRSAWILLDFGQGSSSPRALYMDRGIGCGDWLDARQIV